MLTCNNFHDLLTNQSKPKQLIGRIIREPVQLIDNINLQEPAKKIIKKLNKLKEKEEGFLSFPHRSKVPKFDPVELIGQSAYLFLLIPNIYAWGIAMWCIFVQLALMWLFFVDSLNKGFDSYRLEAECDDIGMQPVCVYETGITLFGGSLGLGLSLLGSLPSLLTGLQLFRCSWVQWTDIRTNIGVSLAAITNILIGISCIVVGMVYGLAASNNNIDFIQNIVVVLFIEKIDEGTYEVLGRWSPVWLDMQKEILNTKYVLQHELSTSNLDGNVEGIENNDNDHHNVNEGVEYSVPSEVADIDASVSQQEQAATTGDSTDASSNNIETALAGVTSSNIDDSGVQNEEDSFRNENDYPDLSRPPSMYEV